MDRQDTTSIRVAISRVSTSLKKRCCSTRTWKNKLPITSWLPHYSLQCLHGDIIAGISVALTVIPQGLAISLLAHLPPQYGLYTAFMGSMVYSLFGTCKDLVIGPTSVMAIMTSQYVLMGGPSYAVLLSFLIGIFQLTLGVFNLGFIVEFISFPVISGFTSAAAITIAGTQIKHLFGMKMSGDIFSEVLVQFVKNIRTIQLADSLLGIACIIVLLLIRHFKDRRLSVNSTSIVLKAIDTIWWFIGTGRNALMVVLCGGAAALLDFNGHRPFKLTGKVQGGVPPLALPPFSVDFNQTSSNETIHKNFDEMFADVYMGVLIIGMLSVLEGIAIAKAFTKGKNLDSTQEMIALGMCNIAGSFVSAFPVTGSFSRSAINNNSGVKTPLGGVFTGLVVLCALQFLAPYFYFIPKATLAAIVITAVIFMVHYKDVAVIWNTHKIDMMPFVATLLAAFFLSLEYGIMLGFVVSVVLLLLYNARPKLFREIRQTNSGRFYLYVRPDRSIMFPACARSVASIVNDASDANKKEMSLVVVDGAHIVAVDSTTAQSVHSLSEGLKKINVTLAFVNINSDIQKSLKWLLDADFVYAEIDNLDKFFSTDNDFHRSSFT